MNTSNNSLTEKPGFVKKHIEGFQLMISEIENKKGNSPLLPYLNNEGLIVLRYHTPHAKIDIEYKAKVLQYLKSDFETLINTTWNDEAQLLKWQSSLRHYLPLPDKLTELLNENPEYSGTLLELLNDIAYGLHTNLLNYEKLYKKAHNGTFHTGIYNNKLIIYFDTEEDKPANTNLEYAYWHHCYNDLIALKNTEWKNLEHLQEWFNSLKHYPRIVMGKDFDNTLKEKNMFNIPLNFEVRNIESANNG